MENKVRRLFEKGKPAVGTFLVSRSQAALEVLAAVGFDFVVIDAEHFMVNIETLEHLVTAAESAGIAPFVRVQENVNLIGRALDCGALGIVAPMINTPEEARAVVNAAKFIPEGTRGVCNPRTVVYGAKGIDYMKESYKRLNAETVIAVQIETSQAVDNLPEIAEVKGIDCLFIGPWDLANSLGITGEVDNPQLTDKVDEAFQIGNARRIPMGILAWDGEDANKRIKQGYKFIIVAGDTLFLASGAHAEISKIER